MDTPLLSTKLYIPPVRPELVSRRRLVERLNAGLKRKLTLVSAPAGFGKTTCISEWAHTLLTLSPGGRGQGEGPRVAWLSLDKGDNDPTRFWSHFVAALQTIHAGVGEAALTMLQFPQPPLIEALLTGVINEIVEIATPFVLVLDDFHAITNQQINEAITFLLDNLPPQMHLVLAGRSDPPWPLARLRARREMIELRASDLRFTSGETAAFLNEVMGLSLSPADVFLLEARTEGWIAGLQMAALSMRGRKDMSGFIESFTGSHRYILDYLVEEVLRRQPSDIREYLLKTSILERMTGPLCDAVTGRADSQTILTELERANLFLVPLDDERRWYRYHRLFSDLLRSRLAQTCPDQIPALHCRASEWCEQNGLFAEAMSHASAAGDTDRQVRLIASNVLTMAYLGELATLVQWLDALPVDAGREEPWFHVSHAWVLAFAGRLDAVEPHLSDAEQALHATPSGKKGADPENESDQIAGHIAAIRGYVTGLKGDWRTSIEYVHEALPLLPEKDAIARGWTTLLLAVILRAQGDLVEADQAFSEAVAISRLSGHVPLALDVLWEQSVQQLMLGKLHMAFSTCQDALQLVAEHVEVDGRRLLPTGYTHIGISAIQYEWNDLEASLDSARTAIGLCKRWGMADAIMRSRLRLAITLQAAGDSNGACSAAQEARQVAEMMLSPSYQNAVAMVTAQIHLAQGNVAAASRWADEQGMSADNEFGFQQVIAYTVFARLLIAQSERQAGASLQEALNVLERLGELSASAGAVGNLIGILALKAIALQALGDEAAALKALNRALLYGEPEGYIRTFIDEGVSIGALLRKANASGMLPDYTGKLLQALASEAAMAPEADAEGQPSVDGSQFLAEPLTERELEVLRLLMTSLATTEIAGELVVAPSTVRTHIKSIYGKLGVHRRMQAVERARELGLL